MDRPYAVINALRDLDIAYIKRSSLVQNEYGELLIRNHDDIRHVPSQEYSVRIQRDGGMYSVDLNTVDLSEDFPCVDPILDRYSMADYSQF